MMQKDYTLLAKVVSSAALLPQQVTISMDSLEQSITIPNLHPSSTHSMKDNMKKVIPQGSGGL